MEEVLRELPTHYKTSLHYLNKIDKKLFLAIQSRLKCEERVRTAERVCITTKQNLKFILHSKITSTIIAPLRACKTACQELLIAKEHLKAAAEKEKTNTEYHATIYGETYKCQGLPITVLGSNSIDVDKYIDSVDAIPAILPYISGFRFTCRKCKCITSKIDPPEIGTLIWDCSFCGWMNTPQKIILYNKAALMCYV